MKRFISMLLSLSMMLSLCSSSLSVSAVDTTSTTKTEETGQVSALFENELNEKMADLSNDFGITSVEVTDNTAVVKYHAVKDCTVVIGIYEDDGTNGTHMLSFEKGELKATEGETSIALNNLPNYFYLKAYLIDTETLHPLAKVYETPNYTKSMEEFFELTVDDFPEDRVWNFDDDPGNNFMVLAEKTKVINTDHEIKTSDIVFTSTSITVNKADTDTIISSLKKGDSFIFFADEGVFNGVVSSVNLSADNKTAVINYETAVMSDLFEFIRLETEQNISENSDAGTYSVKRQNINSANYDEEFYFSTTSYDLRSNNSDIAVQSNTDDFSFRIPTQESLGVDFILSTDKDGKIVIEKIDVGDDDDSSDVLEGDFSCMLSTLIDDISMKCHYFNNDGKEKFYIELNMTPTVKLSIKGEFKAEAFAKEDVKFKIIDSLPLANAYGVPVISLNIDVEFGKPTFTATAEGTASFSAKQQLIYDFETGKKELYSDTPVAEISITGSAEISVSATLSAELAFFDTGLEDKDGDSICLFSLGTSVSLTPKLGIEASASVDTENGFNTKSIRHDCEPLSCFNGDIGLIFGLNGNLKVPLIKGLVGEKYSTIEWTLVEENILPEEIQHFNISKANNWIPQFGECDNKSYRTKIIAVDELTDEPIENIYITNYSGSVTDSEYEHGTTGKNGEVTLYLKPNKDITITLSDANDTEGGELRYKKTSIVANVKLREEDDPDEEFVVKMQVNDKPSSITPLPVETEELPQYKIGESLRYTELLVKYAGETIDSPETTNIIPMLPEYIIQYDPYSEGVQTVIIEYNGTQWKHDVEVIAEERHINMIGINTLPDKLRYKIGEELDLTGLTIMALFTDGTMNENPITVTEDMISGFDSSVNGDKTLTITYTDAYGDTAEATFVIKVVDGRVDGIEMETLPDKLEYRLGDEEFFVGGASINVIYNDGTEPETITVTQDMVSGFDGTSPGEKIITVTYWDDDGKKHTTEFTVEVIDKEIAKIEILQLLDKNRYCLLNGALNYEDALLKVYYTDGEEKVFQITEGMTGKFDSSKLGTFMVVVTFGDHKAHYYVDVVESLKKVCRIELYDSQTSMIFADDYIDKPYGEATYYVTEYFLDGTTNMETISTKWAGEYEGEGDTLYRDENNDIIYYDEVGGIIKIHDFDRTQLGVHEVKFEYCNADGTVDTSVKSVSMWQSVHPGLGGFDRTPQVGDKNDFYIQSYERSGRNNSDYMLGEEFDLTDYFFQYDEWQWDDEEAKYTWQYQSPYLKDAEGKNVIDPITKKKVIKGSHCLEVAKYLGGFDSSYSTEQSFVDSREAYFEYDGFVFTLIYHVDEYTLEDSEQTSTASYSEPLALYNNANTLVETSYLQPVPVMTNNSELLKVLSQLKSADFTGLLTDEIYNYYVVKNTNAADILSEDNLLFIGQAVSDSNGKLSVEYETTTGEDGEIILKPMSYIDLSTVVLDINVSNPVYNGKEQTVLPVIKLNGNLLEKDVDYVLSGDVTAKDVGKYTIIVKGIGNYTGTVEISYEVKNSSSGGTANPPSGGGNTGNNGNKPSNPVVPSTSTKTWTVIVKNLITGKTTSANAKRDGNDVVINLGSKNNDYYANVYSADGEFLDGVLIKNGTAKFINLEENNFRIEIDSVPHFDDVSSDAGFYVDEYVTEVTQNKPYAVIILVIAVTGVCIIEWKKKKDRKSNNSYRF